MISEETGPGSDSRRILERSGEVVTVTELSESGDLDRGSDLRDGVLERLDMVLRCRP